MQDAIRARDVATLKRLWDDLVPQWDGRTFYDFIATSQAFSKLPFRYRELFGLVGFGTGGWDSDFPNSMLEILRVVLTNCDTDQQLIVGGAERLPRRLWTLPVSERSPWPAGTTLASLHGGVPRPGVAAIHRQRRTACSWCATAGAPVRYPWRGAGHLPELAADDPDRLRREPLLAGPVDGARPHPLHAVIQDVRDGRPAVLEGNRPRHRSSA